MIDVAMCLNGLVPGAAYGGSLTEDSIARNHGGDAQEAYRALRWEDARTQPSWEEIKAVWPEVGAAMLRDGERRPRDLAAEMDEVKKRLAALESR